MKRRLMSMLGFGTFGHGQTDEARQTSNTQTDPPDDRHANQAV